MPAVNALRNTITFTPEDLDAYVAKRISEAWPMLADSATYWKAEYERILADFQEMSVMLNRRYEDSRAGLNPRHRHESR